MLLSEFQSTYRQMVIEQLLELAAQMEDLVPEAKTALAAELKNRGITQSDIEKYCALKKDLLNGEKHEQSPAQSPSCEQDNTGDANEIECSYMLKGPTPADWIQIPSFSINESSYLAQNMELNKIPFKIDRAPGFGTCQCLLFVPADRFNDAVNALKEHYGLFDEAPELFTGECPACGTKLTASTTCSDCGLALCQNGWDAISGHPFVKFLTQKGLGRKQDG